MKNFDGKVVIVTGASSGIGEAAALKFAREGARVVVAARREDKGQAVVDRIAALGSEGLFIKTDVTNAREVEELVKTTLARFGKLDCAVNNAGVVGVANTPMADITEDTWDQVMKTNLKAVWLCMKYEIRAMLTQGKGAIVNLASIYGLKPSDLGHSPYCASKFGVIGLTQSGAIDYAQHGIRINAVCPGFTHSEMVDPFAEAAPDLMKAILNRHSAQNRLGDAHETAEAIAWLCSDAASFVNGAALPVDGGVASKMY